MRDYHASDKIPGTSLDKSWSHDAVKITVLGVEIRIGRVIGFEAGGKQSKMADDDLVAMDLGVTMLVFYKNWQGIGESPVRNEFHRKASAERWNGQKCCCYGRVSR